jgi:hypothetical protein
MMSGVSRADAPSLRELPFGRPEGVPARPVPRGWRTEPPLFCPCGKTQPEVAGLCRSCYERVRYSDRYFSGLRFQALVRDRFRCRACELPHYPVVIDRQPDQHQLETFVTLCASCHGVVANLERPANWLPPLLLTLWREQHPTSPLQQQFEFSGWQPRPAPAGRIARVSQTTSTVLVEPTQHALFAIE